MKVAFLKLLQKFVFPIFTASFFDKIFVKRDTVIVYVIIYISISHNHKHFQQPPHAFIIIKHANIS